MSAGKGSYVPKVSDGGTLNGYGPLAFHDQKSRCSTRRSTRRWWHSLAGSRKIWVLARTSQCSILSCFVCARGFQWFSTCMLCSKSAGPAVLRSSSHPDAEAEKTTDTDSEGGTDRMCWTDKELFWLCCFGFNLGRLQLLICWSMLLLNPWLDRFRNKPDWKPNSSFGSPWSPCSLVISELVLVLTAFWKPNSSSPIFLA